jgi:MFS family permease
VESIVERRIVPVTKQTVSDMKDLSAIPGQHSIRYAWYVVGLLTLANISSFIDRQILALLIVPIKRDLHLSDTKVSLLMGLSFALFYTLFGIIISRLADNTNRRNIIMGGIAIWSFFTALCAGVKSYGQFFLARMGVGVGEATLSPSAYSLISDYFPKRKLGMALSIFSAGIFLGSGLALTIGSRLVASLPKEGTVIVPLLGEIYHWQKLFLWIGIPGFVISLLLFTVREPVRKGVIRLENLQRQKLPFREALKLVFAYPKTFLGICIGTAFTAIVTYGCTAWIPTYFYRTFDWPVPKTGLIFGLVLLAASICGVLWGGWYSDYLENKGVQNGRIRVGIISAAGLLVSCFIPLISNPVVVMALLFVPAFFIASPIGASSSAIQALMPNQVRAFASSIFIFLINIIGLGIGPFLVAFFTDTVFHNESFIKYSLAATIGIGGIGAILGYVAASKGYGKASLVNGNDENK